MYVLLLIGVDVFDDTSTVSGAILQCKVEEAEMRHKELQRNLEVISKDTVSYGFLVIQIENLPSHQPKLLVIDKVWRDIGMTLFEGFRKLLLPRNSRVKSQKGFFCQVKDFSHWTKESFSKKAIS